jgi:DNA-binding transcriptional MerR regulator
MDDDAEGSATVTTRSATRRILRRQGMPPQEIRAILAAGDPLVVRRLLELHRERLEEWLEEQRRSLATLERSLAAADNPSSAERVLG